MNWNHRARKILITGKSGSGKTSLWLSMLLSWPAQWKFIFDPDREFARKAGVPAAISIEQLNALATARRPVVFDPTVLFPGNLPEAFAFFSRWVLNVAKLFKGPKLLSVDEIQKYTRVGPGGIPKAFQEVLDVGRREEIDLLIIAQRVNQVNDAIRGQLTEIITFCHTDRLPLQWLEEDGFDPEEVRSLAYPGGHIRRDVNRGEQRIVAPDGTGKRNRGAVVVRPEANGHSKRAANQCADS